MPPTDDLPRVELASPGRLVAIRLGGFAINRSETEPEPNPPQPPLNIGGISSPCRHSEKRIIYLPEDWNGIRPAEASVLVHEMVHHLQNVGGLKYPSPTPVKSPPTSHRIAGCAGSDWISKRHSASTCSRSS